MRLLSEDIRYLQLETGTACNYKCRYCPVAYHPRPGGFLSMELVARIAAQLADFPNLSQIYLNGYDEPTLNPRLPEVFRILAPAGVRISLLTNGTRLSVALAEEIVNTGADVEFDFHLSAADPQEFRRIHQSPLYSSVMRRLTALAASPVAKNVEIHISMQGFEDPPGDEVLSGLERMFADSPFVVQRFQPNDRAGLMRNEYRQNVFKKALRGCGLQNRTSEWFHINADGNVILCCQDYFEEHVIGNASRDCLRSLVSSEARVRLHRWTIGADEAPDEYLCRRCAHAMGD